MKCNFLLLLLTICSATIFAQDVTCDKLSVDSIYIDPDGLPGKVNVFLTNHDTSDLWSPYIIAMLTPSGDTLATTPLCGCVVLLPGGSGAFEIDIVKSFTLNSTFTCIVALTSFPYNGDNTCHKVYNPSHARIPIVNTARINLFPNPAKNSLSIAISEPGNSNRIAIVNLKGQVMRSENISGQNATIDISSLAKGIYFVQLYSNGKLATTSKLTKD